MTADDTTPKSDYRRSAGVRSGRATLIVLAIIVLIYILSIVFRAPYIEHPMGLHHDEGTARTLVHSLSWWEEGPSDGGFIMSRTLSSPGDKYLSPSAADDGNIYYYSFPPGHPLWAFAAHRLVGLIPTVLSVRILNLVFGFLSASMVYLIVRELLSRLPDLWSRFAGVIAFTLYVFTPVGLWYHSNAYTSASAVQPFFIAALLVATYSYRPRNERPWLLPLLYGIAVFMMCYTEWLGVAFAVVTVALWVFRRTDITLRRLAIAAAVGAAAALGIVAIQYSISLGVTEMFETVVGRYFIRSGLDASGGGGYTLWSPVSWSRLVRVYVMTAGTLAAGTLALWAWDRFVGRDMAKGFRSGTAPVATILLLSLLPVLLHHVILFDHAVVHDFNMLKTTAFFALAAGVLVGRLLARYSATRSQESLTRPVAGVIALSLIVIVGSLWVFDSVNDTIYYEPQELGASIAAEVEPDEVVFIESPTYVLPATTTYYAGRNYRDWAGDQSLTRAVLDAGGERTGVLFVLGTRLGVVGVGYVGTDGIVYETRAEAKATLDPTASSE